MGNKIEILGIPFDNITRKQTLFWLAKCLKGESNNLIVTANPEIVVEAQKDDELMNIIKSAKLVLPDGTGILWAAGINGQKIKERVTGVEITPRLLKYICKTGGTAYFLGAAPGVARAAADKMMQKYAGLKIVGVHDGYFDEYEEKLIVEDIRRLKPDVLLVGLGQPKQEKWIYKHIDLPVKISMGIGGTFDSIAGTVKRAPKIFIQLNIEWLHRFVMQPNRRKQRLEKLPKFVLYVLKNKFLERKKYETSFQARTYY